MLVGCLAAAGAVAAYSKQFEEASEQTQVFTVHVAATPAVPAPPPVPVTRIATDAPVDRVSLVRELQRELKRVGCYSGDVNGVWTTSSRMAMKSFTDRVNASLPIDNPDDILLSLVRAHREPACAAQCASGQTASEQGRCVVAAKAPAADPGFRPGATESATEATVRASSSVVAPAAVATAAALAGSAAVAKSSPQPDAAETRTKTAAAPADRAVGSDAPDRPARYGRPVPQERVYRRRAPRYSNSSRPPKFVRNVLRAFGIR